MIRFTTITIEQVSLVSKLAEEIWYQNYREMISDNQIDYMLKLMYNPKKITQEIESGYQWEFIYNNKDIIGFLSYTIKDDNRVFLSKIYLRTSAQGLGIGKMSLERVKEYAKSNNCKAVYLTVNKNNKKGIRAYTKAGFIIIAEEVADIGKGYVMDDYIFEFSLTS